MITSGFIPGVPALILRLCDPQDTVNDALTLSDVPGPPWYVFIWHYASLTNYLCDLELEEGKKSSEAVDWVG